MLHRFASAALFPLLVAAMTAFAVIGSTLDPAGALGLAPTASPGLLSLADPRVGNANYGAIGCAWDLVFGTFLRPSHGIFEGPIGLSDLPEFPRGYLAQLASPFQWERIERASGERGSG